LPSNLFIFRAIVSDLVSKAMLVVFNFFNPFVFAVATAKQLQTLFADDIFDNFASAVIAAPTRLKRQN